MKQFTLITLFFSFTITSVAQINKGQFLVGGYFSFESTANESFGNTNFKISTISFSPNIGYFIINNLVGGLRMQIQSQKQTGTVYESNNSMTSFSPFIRYYFLKATKKLNIFSDFSYISYKSELSGTGISPSIIDRENGYFISAGPAIFLSKEIALEFTLGYKRLTMSKPSETKSNTFNTGFGLQIYLGKIRPKSKR